MIASSRFDFDLLGLYFMKPYKLMCGLTVHQPTIGDIVEFGEKEFFTILNAFISNTTSYRLLLWENGVDWNKVKDFELFSTLIRALDKDSTKLLFWDIDFSKLEAFPLETVDPDACPFVLKDVHTGLEINEYSYFELADYLRTMFDIWPKIEKTRRKSTKEAIIEEEKINRATAKKQGVKQQSVLMPLISGCVNHPGFKYSASELKAVGIYQFMDSVRRIGAYEQSVALLHGGYGGFADLSKVDKSLLDFMRDLTAKK